MRHHSIDYMYHVAIRYTNKLLGLRPASFPYISGDTIRTITKYRYEDSVNFDPDKIKGSDIIFVESKNLKNFFNDIDPKINSQYILVSHNSDTNITDEYKSFINSKSLRHWFAQNCLIKDPKITPIPIGLENKWFNLHGLPKYFDSLKSKNITKKTEMLYKFSVSTNPPERGKALSILEKHPLTATYVDWREPLSYLETLQSYKFVVSPPGNGEDCIRTWEAMYLKTIPIVKKSVLTEYFYDCGLPLLLVDSWDEIDSFTPEVLDYKYDTIAPRFESSALGVEYWINKIYQKLNEYK